MSKEEPLEFRLLMARIEHQRRMICRYIKPEEWENLQEGDLVVIDNSDSLHDGERGQFISHDWSVSGYVRLIVAFPDGKKCFYLPTQVVKIYDEPIAPEPATTAEPLTVEDFAPVTVAPEQTPTARITVDEASERIIDAKLAQIAKMPESVRKKVLSSTLPAELVPQALELAVKRGIIPVF